MDLRASAPEFVPSARRPSVAREGGSTFATSPPANEELLGDRLIRQLAAAMAAAPSPTARSSGLTAAGLFCPACISGGPCAFHRPTSVGWAAPPPPPAAAPARPPAVPAGYAPADTWRAAPAGPPAVSLAVVPVEAMSTSHGLACAPGAWRWPGEEQRGVGPGKSAAELLDDMSTDVGGSEQHHADSDASDASPDSVSTNGRRWRGPPRPQQAATCPHRGAAAQPGARATTKQRLPSRQAPARWSLRHSPSRGAR